MLHPSRSHYKYSTSSTSSLLHQPSLKKSFKELIFLKHQIKTFHSNSSLLHPKIKMQAWFNFESNEKHTLTNFNTKPLIDQNDPNKSNLKKSSINRQKLNLKQPSPASSFNNLESLPSLTSSLSLNENNSFKSTNSNHNLSPLRSKFSSGQNSFDKLKSSSTSLLDSSSLPIPFDQSSHHDQNFSSLQSSRKSSFSQTIPTKNAWSKKNPLVHNPPKSSSKTLNSQPTSSSNLDHHPFITESCRRLNLLPSPNFRFNQQIAAGLLEGIADFLKPPGERFPDLPSSSHFSNPNSIQHQPLPHPSTFPTVYDWVVATQSLDQRSFHTTTYYSSDEDFLPKKKSQRLKMKNLERKKREEQFKSSLPRFQLHHPHYTPQTIRLCPSLDHPLSSLPDLLDWIVEDALPLGPDVSGSNKLGYVGLAFDMEWVITYGRASRTALIQLAGRSRTLAIQLAKLTDWYDDGTMPDTLIPFLLNPKIIKIGVGIRNDALKLLRDLKSPASPKPYLHNFLELSLFVRMVDQPKYANQDERLISLQQIVADYLGDYLPKLAGPRMSNWSQTLSHHQLEYAASDVVATVRVMEYLLKVFKKLRQSDPSVTLLDIVDSLEPLEVSCSTPVSSLKNSNLVFETESFTGSSMINLPSSAPSIKRYRVTPRIREAWELWYTQRHSVKICAKKMAIQRISVAIYVSKMYLHLKREYAEDRLEKIQLTQEDEIRIKKEVIDTYHICEKLQLTLSDFGLNPTS
ncbi:hypothetical protein O181_041958 [Austropuccinia psidii MF-1]|uniref:3'-5' exonuclease domain-containing protein n=1 Tax=Austropuccinia psidii MF-1 TaxID=1389203 RepID=A0A9Q3DK74_9BASI|nr:hypothetical protein [Austropuccinia psidii MF-1]